MEYKLDIKMLRTIHTLCACGSVVQTAKILGVSPGAISYTINKARKSPVQPSFIVPEPGWHRTVWPKNSATNIRK